MPNTTPTIGELRGSGLPFVVADHLGILREVNQQFLTTFGWSSDALVDNPLSTVVPETFRMAHQTGFSRFQATGESTVLGHPLKLNVVCADGAEVMSEHLIVAEQSDGEWVFGATMRPLDTSDSQSSAT